jgi:hypothetical protein
MKRRKTRPRAVDALAVLADSLAAIDTVGRKGPRKGIGSCVTDEAAVVACRSSWFSIIYRHGCGIARNVADAGYTRSVNTDPAIAGTDGVVAIGPVIRLAQIADLALIVGLGDPWQNQATDAFDCATLHIRLLVDTAASGQR